MCTNIFVADPQPAGHVSWQSRSAASTCGLF